MVCAMNTTAPRRLRSIQKIVPLAPALPMVLRWVQRIHQQCARAVLTASLGSSTPEGWMFPNRKTRGLGFHDAR